LHPRRTVAGVNGPGADPDPNLLSALTSAADACRQALIDYEAGLLDEAERARSLVRLGLVLTANEAWMLDATTHRWWRYDGGAPRVAHEQRDALA
jgi:hypothetical protein